MFTRFSLHESWVYFQLQNLSWEKGDWFYCKFPGSLPVFAKCEWVAFTRPCTCTSWCLVTLIDYWTWVTKTFQILYFKIRNFKDWFLSNISQQIYILHLSYNKKTIWFVHAKVKSMQVGNFTFQIHIVHLKRSMFI